MYDRSNDMMLIPINPPIEMYLWIHDLNKPAWLLPVRERPNHAYMLCYNLFIVALRCRVSNRIVDV